MRKYRALNENSTDVIKWQTRIAESRVDNPNYADYQAVIEWVESGPFRTEHFQYPISVNTDIPHDPQLVEMGCNENANPFLSHTLGDPRTMNEAHFFDLCLKYGSKLLAMFEKRSADFDPMVFNRPEELMEWLECEYHDAHTIAHCLKRFEFNKSLARRMIFGHTTSEGVRKPGFKNLGEQNAQTYAEMLSELVEQLPELPPNGQNMVSLDTNYYEAPAHLEDITDNPWSKLSILLEEQPDPDVTIYTNLEDPDELPGYIDAFGNEDDVVLGDDGIGTFPMWDGTESLDHEYVDRVRRANVDQIWEIQQEMYPQRINGRWQPAINASMTPQQKAFAWQFINDRKSQLLELAVDQATEETRQVIEMFKQMDERQKKPLVLSYINGRKFNNKGHIIDFLLWSEQRPSSSDQFLLWHELRKLA